MIVNYGFDKLKLKKIHTKIFAENAPSLHIASKCGFEEKAILEKDVVKNGVLYDRIYLVIDRNRWEKLHKEDDE